MFSSLVAILALAGFACASPVSVEKRTTFLSGTLYATRLHPSSPSLAFNRSLSVNGDASLGFDGSQGLIYVSPAGFLLYMRYTSADSSRLQSSQGNNIYHIQATGSDCFGAQHATGNSKVLLYDCGTSGSSLAIREEFTANDKGDYVVFSLRGRKDAQYPSRPYLAIENDQVYVTDQKNSSDHSQIRLVLYKSN